MLIDDDKHDNFFHERVIRKAGIAEQIVPLTKPEKALEYLEKSPSGEGLTPELIFLDINMPRIDGWAFIDSYKDLQNSSLKHTKVVILTTSIDPEEQFRAETDPHIAGFQTKPLTAEMLEEIILQHFA